MKKLFAKLKALVSAFFCLIAVFFQAKSSIKNLKVILLIGAQKPSPKSHHLDEALLFVNCLGCGFKINLFGARQWLILLNRLGKEGIALLNWANLGNSPNPGGGRLLFVNIVSFKDLSIGVQCIVISLESLKGLVIKEALRHQRQSHWRVGVIWEQPSLISVGLYRAIGVIQ